MIGRVWNARGFRKFRRNRLGVAAGIVILLYLMVAFAVALGGTWRRDPRVFAAMTFVGLTLGAVAVAVALSFGLGGREAAGKQMEHWLSRFRGEQ